VAAAVAVNAVEFAHDLGRVRVVDDERRLGRLPHRLRRDRRRGERKDGEGENQTLLQRV
jgi:hypothetical protein